jgi:hypothetical protein
MSTAIVTTVSIVHSVAGVDVTTANGKPKHPALMWIVSRFKPGGTQSESAAGSPYCGEAAAPSCSASSTDMIGHS